MKARPEGRNGQLWAMNHRSDALLPAVLVVFIAFQAWAYSSSISPWAAIAITVALRWAHLMTHTHAHTPVFQHPGINRGYGLLLFWTTALQTDLYIIHHVDTHHRFTNVYRDGAGDWTSPFAYRGARFPDKPVGLVKYLVTFMPRAWIRASQEVRQRSDLALTRRVATDCGLFLAVAALLLYMRPHEFVIFFILPWSLLYLGTPWTNWMHHRRCEFSTWQDSANDSLGVFHRRLGLNIGYHSAHHVYPASHWSSLPALHASLEEGATRRPSAGPGVERHLRPSRP